MKYKANPVEVVAYRIIRVVPMADGRAVCHTEDGAECIASVEMMARFTPSAGDYWVVQGDGYEYLNPKDVFERKYSALIPAGTPAVTGPVDFTRARFLTAEVEAAVSDAFEYHKWTPEQIESGSRLRRALELAVLQIINDVPPGPDRTTAIRKIREARMDANSAITHGGKY